MTTRDIAIIGGGPAGLIAAETASAAGARVTLCDRMPSVGRKFLMAGRGGLNLTHSEDFESFVSRYGAAAPLLRPMLEAFPPSALIAWANGLGQETFTGTSGRVFPKAMKASPLLRAWLARLAEQGVVIRARHDWLGWDEAGALRFRAPEGEVRATPHATILALGGASWPRLGSTGNWTDVLKDADIAALAPANCGFTIAWSEHLRERFAGQPLKNVQFRFGGRSARGEAIVTAYGLEGGAIYALSSFLRDGIARDGSAVLELDLRPGQSRDQVLQRLAKPRGKDSQSTWLRKTLSLSPLEIALLRETNTTPENLKSLALTLTGAQPLARAISTAGGVRLSPDLMLKPGVFVAGEMLDWEAPTGGYLLQACFATGIAAAKAALKFMQEEDT
jgi:uncharacterized flavoprotein (TIGR03862 family)